MQLIVETETALDIDRNMSTVEDIQNNKVENLDIENPNKLCNGNKNIREVDTTAENGGSKEDISEVEVALSNIPKNIDNNYTELRKIDLSEIISKRNTLEASNDSQDQSGDQERNGSDTTENEKTNGFEEDDLEDDIISIREEPFNVISEQQNNTEKFVEDSNGISIAYMEDTLVDEKELTEETEEPPTPICCNSSIEDENDVIELIEESDDSPAQCENESEQPMLEGKDEIEVIEDLVKSPVQNEKETETFIQEDIGDVEFIEESEKSPLQCENEKCDGDVMEEAPVHCVKEAETVMEVEIIEESEKNPNQRENTTETLIEEIKDDVEVIEELEKSPDQCEKETDRLVDEGKGNVEVLKETGEAHVQCENKIETATAEGKGDVKFVKESEKLSLQCENKTKTLMNEEKGEVIENTREPHPQCEGEKEKLTDEGKSAVQVIGEPEKSPLQCEKEIETLMDEDIDDVEVIEEKEKSPVQCEQEIKALEQGTKDDEDAIKKLVSQCDTKTKSLMTEEIHATKITVETKTVTTCEKKINLPSKESKISDETEIAKDKVDNRENVKETTCEDKTNELMKLGLNGENKITDEAKVAVVHEDLPMEGEVKDKVKVTEDVPSRTIQSCGKEPDTAVQEKDEIRVTKDVDVLTLQIENKTDPPTENEVASDRIESMETVEMNPRDAKNSTETLKSESVVIAPNIDVIDSPINDNVMDVEETTNTDAVADTTMELRDDMDVEDLVEETTSKEVAISQTKTTAPVHNVPVNSIMDKPIICKLSNTLDILSDEDDDDDVELPKVELSKLSKAEPPKLINTEGKQCIDIEDDDDIMVIDEDTNKTKTDAPVETINKEETPIVKTDSKTGEETNDLLRDRSIEKDTVSPVAEPKATDINETTEGTKIHKPDPPSTLVPDNFLKTAKKKLADMTRDELEEFCILKIVESIVDRSSLSDIKNKLKTITQGLEEHRRKAMMLTKQNRDLQVVLKSVQEEQKKATGDTCITPLKINRSVGMQVFMEKTVPKKKGQPQNAANKTMPNPQNKNINALPGPRPQKIAGQPIPVPRLVPANSPVLKTPSTIPQVNQMNTPNVKNLNTPNGAIKTTSPALKAEKRTHNKIASNMTVDLTDDEPPAKMPGGPKTSPAPPVRLIPPQNLMPPQRQAFGTAVNSPRKVYIPISGPQNQALRPGQTIMLKTVPAGMRPRCPPPQVTRVESNTVRMNRVSPRHPAPLPYAMKQYQPPNWKSLPPAPDLKLSKVENGIVISWKIEDVPEDSYEEIASYQLYAYQETSQPPSTSLWKKIGDVKALPLPMACTLTQFMAGFKYYFAVRAVDIRSRLGPFSLPGSILLLSKNI